MATYADIYTEETIEQALKVLFQTLPFYRFYSLIDQQYKEYGFADELTDAQRIAEYSTVYQQLRKFIAKSEAPIMKMRDRLDTVYEWISEQLERSDIYPKTRTEMVYTALKYAWLVRAANQVKNLMGENGEDMSWLMNRQTS